MSDYNWNESNYDSKTKNNVFNNDTTFSQKRFGELVTKVSNLETTLTSEGNSCNCDNWEWNPTPVYETTLTNGFDYDDEDGTTYDLPASIFNNHPKALLVSFFKENTQASSDAATFSGVAPILASFNNGTSIRVIINNIMARVTNDNKFGFDCLIVPYHGLYIIHCVPIDGNFSAYSEKGNPTYSKICWENFGSTAINSFSIAYSIPSNTKITVFTNK